MHKLGKDEPLTTTPWETLALAVTAVQVSQGWALRDLGPYGAATFLAGPSVMVTVMLAGLWMTGTSSLPWITAWVLAGLAAQVAGGRLRRKRAREEGGTGA